MSTALSAEPMGQKHKGLHRLGDRFDWVCQHCGRTVHCQTCEPRKRKAFQATRDHLLPRTWGGRGGENLALSCWVCNHRKGDGT